MYVCMCVYVCIYIFIFCEVLHALVKSFYNSTKNGIAVVLSLPFKPNSFPSPLSQVSREGRQVEANCSTASGNKRP